MYFFVNKEHEENFINLLSRYPIGKTDNEYRAGFYIVAHPVIYSHCNGNPVSDGNGPFDWYFEELDNPSPYSAALSSSYSFLVRAGIHLYNGYEDFTLYLAVGTWGDELFKVFVQACQIRRGR